MSKETREHLSSLVDGEINPETSRFLVKRLGSDVELRATWTRYHLVRDCLRHQDGAMAGDDLCARISKAIESEEPVQVKVSPSRRWLKPLTGVAIAASVALMAITAVGPGTLGTAIPASGVTEANSVEQFTSPQSVLGSSPTSSQASLSNGPRISDRKMDAYLLRHYQASGATGGKGFVMYVPMVITNSKSASNNEQDVSEAVATDNQEEEADQR